jgi:aminopeptidase YwaD
MGNPSKTLSEAAAALELIRNILSACGGRAPGSPGSRKAAGMMAEAFGGRCDRAGEESFTFHPGSLWGMGRIVSTAYLLSVPLLALGGFFALTSAAVLLAAASYAVTHYFFYGRAFDGLFKKAEGLNAVGVIEPEEEAGRQVVVCGHHDSAYVFNFLSRVERLAGLRLLLAVVFFLCAAGMSVYGAFSYLLAGAWNAGFGGMTLLLAGAAFVLPLFFFFSRKVSPGAGDNLSGCALAVAMASHFGGRKAAGKPLGHTRLIFLSLDGEEAGQRGAAAWVARHRRELAETKTFVLNIDSVYALRHLAALKTDMHGMLPLSARMAEDCRGIAAQMGYSMTVKAIPFGGGGTDAIPFARAGVEAVSIVAMPTDMFGEGHFYHTDRDTPENIEPEAMQAVFEIAVQYIERLDGSNDPFYSEYNQARLNRSIENAEAGKATSHDFNEDSL